ncbi:MAG TPA: UPF0158 family protein [Pyrinomonadaceae bacterium]|jgi:hypothetical protein
MSCQASVFYFIIPRSAFIVSKGVLIMKREEIDHEALIAAVETELPDIEHFLDLRTGEVVIVVAANESAETGELDEIAADNRRLAARVRAEPERYERVPSIAPEAGFRWMQEFAASIADGCFRAEMQQTLRGCTDNCFEAFRHCLQNAPESERERWFAFRYEKIEEFIDEWLEGKA